MKAMSRAATYPFLHLSRRELVGAGLAAAGMMTLTSWWASVAYPMSAARLQAPAAPRTWLLTSPDELRPSSPDAPSAVELTERDTLAANRTGAMNAAIARWADGPIVLPWTNLALDLVVAHGLTPPHTARALALLHTALYDTVLSVRDAQSAYGRPTFPSEHAAVACAATHVLLEVFPDEPKERLAALVEEAAESRIWAGAAVRSEVDAGLDLGRAVGERAVAWARSDGSDAVWHGERPSGEGMWEPTPPDFVESPLDPMAGTWRTWLVPDVAAARPTGPPAWGSRNWQAEVAAVQDAVARRTPAQIAAAEFWGGGPGTVTPAGIWIEIARYRIIRDGLESLPAARVLALTSVALADAFVCCWDAKYAYWYARPVTADPSLAVLETVPTPPFPSYTSGHSTISAAAATVLGHFFPVDVQELRAHADEARDSRLWAGIHYPIDNELGATLGAIVGRIVADYARQDGSA